MTDTTPQPDVVPSNGSLLKATLIVLAATAVVLVTIALPAEYGIDPLGAGRALGLLNTAATGTTAAPATGANAPAATGLIVEWAPMVAKAGGPIAPQPSGFKVDAIDMLLIPEQAVEYKYRLEKGASMIYSWKADGPLTFDFHTVPDGKPLSASERFEAAEKTEVHGVYTAPYTGLHGWWWQNRTKDMVTFTVTTAGFYTSATMFSDGEQIPFEVKDPPPPPEQ